LSEVQPQLFVGVVSARVRETIVRYLRKEIGLHGGGATLVYAATTAQGFQLICIGDTPFQPIDMDGMVQMVRRISP
jgi:CRISPR-associated endoribonuclease Cas2 subtype I-E